MKKALLALISFLFLAGVIYFNTEKFSVDNYENSKLNKRISTRLMDSLGLKVHIEKAEIVNGNELLLNNVSIYGMSSPEIPFLVIGTLRGFYNVDDLNNKNIYNIENATAENLILPYFEISDSANNLSKKLNSNFREIFKEWDNLEEIEKIRAKIINLNRGSKLLSLKRATEIFKKSKELELLLPDDGLKSLKKSRIKDHIKSLKHGIKLFEKGQSSDLDMKAAPILGKQMSRFLSKKDFFELELWEFLVKKKMGQFVSELMSNLNQFYKAQFYSPGSSEELPHLYFKKIFFQEGVDGSDKWLIGHILNLASNPKSYPKTEILVQGNFEKYNLKGIDLRSNVYRDQNKVITFQLSVLGLSIKDYVFYEDKGVALKVNEATGKLDVRGIIRKDQSNGDVSYKMSNIDFYRSPTLDNVIHHVLDDYISKEKKDFVVIYRQQPRKEPQVHFEFGPSFLDTQEPSVKMYQAYLKDLKSIYFSNFLISNEEIRAKVEGLKSDYERAQELLTKLKETDRLR